MQKFLIILCIIILVTGFHSMKFVDKDFDYIYKFYREERDITFNINRFEEDFLNSSHINDIKNDWDMSLVDLRIQYIRDKKINDLLK